MLKGIKTDALDAVKIQILSSPTLRSDFTARVSLYKDFISQKSCMTVPRNLQIAGVSQDTGSEKVGGKRKASGNGNEGLTDGVTPIPCNQRFYSKAEYNQLSQGNKVYLRQLADDVSVP